MKPPFPRLLLLLVPILVPLSILPASALEPAKDRSLRASSTDGFPETIARYQIFNRDLPAAPEREAFYHVPIGEERGITTVPGPDGFAVRFDHRSMIAAPLDVSFETHPKLSIVAWVKLPLDREESDGADLLGTQRVSPLADASK